MAEADEQVTITRPELDTLLAVARLYLDAFTDDDPMSFTELWGYQDVQETVEKYTDPAAVVGQPEDRRNP